MTTGSKIWATLPDGQSDGLVTVSSFARLILAVEHDPVDDVRRRRDEVEPRLPLEAVAGDLQVQQAEEAAAEPEAERSGRLRLVGERGVVELQLVERLAQVRVLRAVDGVEARVDHRPRLPVAGERLGGAVALARDRVADLGLADVLHPGDEVADLTHPQAPRRLGLRRDDAHLEQLVRGPRGHHLDPLAGRDPAVDDADVGDDAAVGVVDRVEDHRPGRGVGVADGSRDAEHDLVEQLLDADAGLRADPQHVARVAADDVRDLRGVAVGVRGRQVDLVEDRDDRQVLLERQVEVRQRLRLDALRGVDQQHRTLARLQRAAHLVGEVDVPGGVDEVQDDLLAGAVLPGDLPRQPDVLRLDRDPALALDVHAVEVLSAHVARLDDAGELQHAVGQRRLAVVDVGDDAEVPDPRRRGEGLVGERRHVGGSIQVGTPPSSHDRRTAPITAGRAPAAAPPAGRRRPRRARPGLRRARPAGPRPARRPTVRRPRGHDRRCRPGHRTGRR